MADAAVDTAVDGADGARGDTAVPRDAAVGTCDAARVEVTLCPDVACDEGPQWYWNGDSCFPIECGACTGPDCESGIFEESECLAAHAECDASLCRDTAGTWRWWAEECDHWLCGSPQPVTCEVGRAVCDCGAHRRFDPELGCVDDTSCPIAEPISDEELCEVSGGAWENICCHTDCGDFCPEECLAPACNCGPGKVFEAARGCVEASHCFEREEGETCAESARCQGGTICCQTCGGVGCVGPATCRFPLCDDDENIDLCGNNLLAP
jgi:hypothetical protein